MLGPTLGAVLSPGTFTLSRIAVILVLAAAGVRFVESGWPRARRIRIWPAQSLVEVDGRPPVAFGGDSVLRLAKASPPGLPGPLRYGVELASRSTPPLLLLAGPDPAAVVRDLGALRSSLGLPVAVGWGLPANAPPWTTSSERVASVTSASKGVVAVIDSESVPVRRRVATTLFVGTLGVTALVFMDIHGRLVLGEVPSRFSLTLPAIGVSLLFAIALAIATHRERLAVNSHVTSERRLCGVPYERRTIERSSIRHAYLVAPDGETPRHLLLDTESGPVSFPCRPDEGNAALEALTAAGR